MSKKEISPTRSPNPTRDELREEVRGVLESFLTSEIRRRVSETNLFAVLFNSHNVRVFFVRKKSVDRRVRT